MKNSVIAVLVLIGLAVAVFFASAYTVDETEQVVITQFRKVVGDPIREPGLKFRVPFLQKPNYFPKNIQAWDGEPGEVITKDKTYIWVDTFARWRIVDPVAFIRMAKTMKNAQYRLNEIINPAVRDAITSHKLIETVRSTNRKMSSLELADIVETEEPPESQDTINTGRAGLTREILKASQPKLSNFGIELIDVKIKRVNYVPKVRDSVYNRMIAERKQIAEKIRSEGRGEAQKIEGDKERDLLKIRSEAYRTAQKIKGEADAEAIRIYADAYGVDPEFYSFVKSLEVYKDSLNSKSRVLMGTDSELFQYLKKPFPNVPQHNKDKKAASLPAK